MRNQLDAYLLADASYSAQLTVYHEDEVVVDLSGGAELDNDSITGVFSASKGLSAIVIALLVQEGSIDLDRPVVHYWPEFGDFGKSSVTVAQLLSHQAGLPGVDGGIPPEEFLDSGPAARRLAAQRPMWVLGSAIGYHGLTIGVLMEELVRRVTGQTLQQRYEELVRAPRDIDIYLGLPETDELRFRPVRQPVLTHAEAAAADLKPKGFDSLASVMSNMGQEGDIFSGPMSINGRRLHAAGPAAFGAVGSARGLARLYAATLGHIGDPLLNAETIGRMSQRATWGLDCVLNAMMSFAIVYQKPTPAMNFGSYRAFGHDGAGGALGFADPLYEMGFGYIPLPMQYPTAAAPFPGAVHGRAIRLSELARECVARRN